MDEAQVAQPCRICLDTNDQQSLISPCDCTGTMKYVHRQCITEWLRSVMTRVLANPTEHGARQLLTCLVCKARLNIKLPTPRRPPLKLSPAAFALFRKSIPFLLIPICLSGVLLIFGQIIGAVLLVLLIPLMVLMGMRMMGLQLVLKQTPNGFAYDLGRYARPFANLRPGSLIKATDSIRSGVFHDTTILISQYSTTDTTVGFVLNKKMQLPGRIASVNVGGPVSLGRAHVIHSNPLIEGCKVVGEGVYLDGRVEGLTETDRKLVVYGCAAWKPGQLDGEIKAGAWTMHNIATAEDVFATE